MSRSRNVSKTVRKHRTLNVGRQKRRARGNCCGEVSLRLAATRRPLSRLLCRRAARTNQRPRASFSANNKHELALTRADSGSIRFEAGDAYFVCALRYKHAAACSASDNTRACVRPSVSSPTRMPTCTGYGANAKRDTLRVCSGRNHFGDVPT